MNIEIVVVGTAILDTFLLSDQFDPPIKDRAHPRRLLECFQVGSKIELQNVIYSLGGGGLNSATALARLGFQTHLVASVGHDQGRVRVLTHCREENIHWRGSVTERVPTGESFIITTKDGERTILVHRGAAQALPPVHAKEELRWGSAAVFAQHWSDQQTEISLLAYAKRRKLRILWVPSIKEITSHRFFLEASRYVECIVLNAHEAALAASCEDGNWKCIYQYFRRFPTAVIAITRGPDGAVVLTSQSILIAPAPKVNALDTTGAGDSFAATYFGTLLQTENPTQALGAALYNSASVVTQIGAISGLAKSIPQKSVKIKEKSWEEI